MTDPAWAEPRIAAVVAVMMPHPARASLKTAAPIEIRQTKKRAQRSTTQQTGGKAEEGESSLRGQRETAFPRWWGGSPSPKCPTLPSYWWRQQLLDSTAHRASVTLSGTLGILCLGLPRMLLTSWSPTGKPTWPSSASLLVR